MVKKSALIGFVQLGQSVRTKFDAYDDAIFGSRHGQVTYISPDTIMDESVQAQRNMPVAQYRVYIRLDEEQEAGKPAIKILSGMTVVAEIKARDRTVLSYLTKPITRTLAQGMGER